MQNQLITRARNALKKLIPSREKQLVAKAIAGDGDAFGKLYLNYLDALYRYVFYRVNQDAATAEDIVEVVFTKAWEHMPRFDLAKGSFKAWLYQICRTSVIDHYRAEKHTFSLDHPEAMKKPDGQQNPEEIALNKVEYAGVMRAFKHLTPAQQEIMTLKYINDLSNREIAQITGKREDAIRAICHRSLTALKTFVETEVL